MLHPFRYAAILTGLAAALTLTGCPDLPGPLFDATGNYTGTWEDALTGDVCPITLKLKQNVDLFFPLDHQIIGTAELEPGCLVPGELLDQFFAGLPALSIPVFGSMTPGTGEIALSVDTELFDLPFDIAISFDGAGEPGNLMFWMDHYSGNYTFSLTIATGTEDMPEYHVESAGTFMVDITSGF